jgi:hypothetical protein
VSLVHLVHLVHLKKRYRGRVDGWKYGYFRKYIYPSIHPFVYIVDHFKRWTRWTRWTSPTQNHGFNLVFVVRVDKGGQGWTKTVYSILKYFFSSTKLNVFVFRPFSSRKPFPTPLILKLVNLIPMFIEFISYFLFSTTDQSLNN